MAFWTEKCPFYWNKPITDTCKSRQLNLAKNNLRNGKINNIGLSRPWQILWPDWLFSEHIFKSDQWQGSTNTEWFTISVYHFQTVYRFSGMSWGAWGSVWFFYRWLTTFSCPVFRLYSVKLGANWYLESVVWLKNNISRCINIKCAIFMT